MNFVNHPYNSASTVGEKPSRNKKSTSGQAAVNKDSPWQRSHLWSRARQAWIWALESSPKSVFSSTVWRAWIESSGLVVLSELPELEVDVLVRPPPWVALLPELRS